ncbi:hypothetical protein [Nocardia bovistercoris]|uniref:Uncharacterized protein n=1 Tax=Nocardia bovistercoris TaxID=2785916 RepID=A0A931IC57_9NOCA|nr:hypothetical protein [Nocardia bovistercoris]MBH0778709.1 hypothetical protein [Nocardia bovistercoris]
MTDLEMDPAAVSTPLCRAAGRLQSVLPPGWRVEVAVEPNAADGRVQPVLRLVLPER